MRITKPFVSPRQWLREITGHWVLSNANGPMGDLTEQDGSPAFLPPSHVLLCPPLSNPSSMHSQSRLQEVDAHPLFLLILIVALGHLQMHFSPRLQPPPSCASCFRPRTCVRQKTTKRQEREEEVCDLSRTSSQDGRCAEGGTQGACVKHACRVCESMFACVSACVSVRVPVDK